MLLSNLGAFSEPYFLGKVNFHCFFKEFNPTATFSGNQSLYKAKEKTSKKVRF